MKKAIKFQGIPVFSMICLFVSVLILSNNPGSHCSSLGHYRVGRNRNMYRRPVPAFEVYGLENSNSNALSRGILIHPSAGSLTLVCFGMPVFRYNEISDWLKSMPTNIVLWAYND